MKLSPTPTPLASPEFKRLLDQCIHCGMCLQACPTYAVFGTEMDSPRGRIAMMRAAADGRIGLEGALREHIAVCLSCRSCETACPSGVRYGELVDTVRVAAEQARAVGVLERFIRRVALVDLMPHAERLRFIARLLRIYQVAGLQRLVRSVSFLPKRLRVLESLLPSIESHHLDYRRPAPARPPRQGTVAFFYGCVQEAFLSRVNEDTVRVLQRNGYEVQAPTSQTCCGAAALHVGEEELSRRLARQNIDAFLGGDFEAIITNAGGCGAMLKDYPRLLREDSVYAEKAALFAARVQDVSEFLADHLRVPPQGRVNGRVTYADSCHLRHAQKVIRQPRDLLRLVPGLELVELQQPERCCGSAGVYNILQIDTAAAVLDAKIADIAATEADIVVTTNTGCYLQLTEAARRASLNVRVVHLVEILEQSYAAQESAGKGADLAGS